MFDLQMEHQKEMLKLEQRAIELGDTRLAKHIRREIDPPKQPKNQQLCKQLDDYYNRQAAEEEARRKSEEAKW